MSEEQKGSRGQGAAGHGEKPEIRNPKSETRDPGLQPIAPNPAPVLQAQDVWRVFETGTERLEVLKGVDFAAGRGEIIAILGPSGTGKSTLLHILGGLDRPTRGRVILDSQDVFSYSETQLHELRNRKVGFVFQFHHLLAEFTVLENVAMPLLIAGADRKSALERAGAALEGIGFTSRLKHRPAELSGGERARAALGRALVNDPAVILADEPTGNLDATSALALVDLLERMTNERKMTTVVVTHNRSVADRATRRLELRDGKLYDEAV